MEIRRIIEGIKKSHLVLWVSLSLVSTVPIGLLFLTAPTAVENTLLLLASKGIMFIAFSFVFAQPIFLGAGIFFSTKEAHHSLIKSVNERNVFRKFILRFIVYLVFVIIYMTTFCCSVLLIIAILAGNNAILILALIPGVTVAALTTTLFLSSIATFLVMLFDDWKLSSAIGAAFYFALAHITGYPIYSLTYREIAVLGPVYYYLGLAVILSGTSFESPAAMAFYFGMYFVSDAFFIPTIIFTLVFVLALLGAVKVFLHNQDRWILESAKESATGKTLFDMTPEQIKRLDSLKHGLKIRRVVTVTILIVMMLIIPAQVTNYTNERRKELYTLVYISPDQGESIEIGQWFNKSFVAQGPPDFSKWMHCYCHVQILSWSNVSELRVEYYLVATTMENFQTMNDTEIVQRGEKNSEILTETNNVGLTAFHLSYGLDYVLALRFLNPENIDMVGNLTVIIVIENMIS